MKFNIITIVALFASLVNTQAQTVLSFEEALAHTLAHNYNILMGQVSEEIADNNASMTNNGFLPTVSANGGYNWSYFQGENQLINETRTFDPNNSYSYNAGASVNYTLFNGFGRKYTYLQAKENAKISSIQLQQTIQNTIIELGQLYHEVARLQEAVATLQEALSISEDRYKRALYGYEYGQAKHLDVLNAKVDVNTDSIALITGMQQLENTKRSLNYVMGKDISENILVDKNVKTNTFLSQEEVLDNAISNNLDIRLANSNIQNSEYGLGLSNSRLLPSISASAGYTYSGTDNPNGAFLIGSKNYGPQAGLTLSWTLFNGQNNKQRQNAKLGVQVNTIQKESLEQNIRSKALNAHANYQNLLFVLKAQEDNLETANDNFIRSEESYKQGQITSVAFRQAQINLLNAEQALSKARYNAKNAEFQLLGIMGLLVK